MTKYALVYTPTITDPDDPSSGKIHNQMFNTEEEARSYMKKNMPWLPGYTSMSYKNLVPEMVEDVGPYQLWEVFPIDLIDSSRRCKDEYM